jgi:hypothetical protein
MSLQGAVTKPRKVILSFDPALKGGNYDDYRNSLFDEKYLSFKEGETPTRFYLRQLSEEHRDAISAQSTGVARLRMAIRCALLSVENYSVRDADTGLVKDVLALETEDAGELGKVLTLDAFKSLKLIDDWRSALFILIMEVSNPSFPLLPPSSPGSGDTEGSKTENENERSEVPATVNEDVL